MKSLFHCKKAQHHNYLAVILFLFAFGFLSMLGYVLLFNYIDQFDSSGMYTGVVKSTGDKFLGFYGFMDYMTVFVMVVLIVGVGITSYKLATPPVFFLLTLFMGALLGFVSYFFNYVFKEIVTDSTFAVALGVFPRTILICTNLHWVMLAVIIVGSVTLYAKRDTGQFQPMG